MDIYLIISIAFAAAFSFFLIKMGWKTRHVLSLLLGFIFVFEFSSNGAALLTPIFPHINASFFWLIAFIVIYVGGATVSAIPLALHNFKKERKKIIKIFKMFIVLGLVYTAIDNFTMGPFAAGPHSPYMGKSLCSLDATYYSEDVFFGCMLEKIHMDPFTNTAAFLTYNTYTLFLLLIAGAIIGYKRLEKIVFEEESV